MVSPSTQRMLNTRVTLATMVTLTVPATQIVSLAFDKESARSQIHSPRRHQEHDHWCRADGRCYHRCLCD